MSCVATRGPHDLQDISRRGTGEGPGITEVVRWCCNCGAVVVDIDVDGRTDPGRALPMQFPKLALSAARKN